MSVTHALQTSEWMVKQHRNYLDLACQAAEYLLIYPAGVLCSRLMIIFEDYLSFFLHKINDGYYPMDWRMRVKGGRK
jgi:hypothetical protein